MFRLFGMRHWDVLVALYIGFVCVSELMGAKTFSFGIGPLHLHATVVLFILPFIYTINDMVAEVYGKARAQSLVRASLVVIGVLLAFSVLAVALPTSKQFAASEPAYQAVFGLSARISAASLIAFSLSEFADVLVFTRLRQWLGLKRLWLRTNVSNASSELLDALLFMSLAFYNVNTPFASNLSFLASIALPYWLIRCVMSVIETPLVYAGVRWLRQAETGEQL